MGRVLAIDYGTKRTGLAVTDPLRIIATPLDVIETKQLVGFLKKYFEQEEVDEVIIGMPRQLNNQPSAIAAEVSRFIENFKMNFSKKNISTIDERFTSSIAQQTMIAGGMKKKDRQVKGNVDKISATLILQSWMQSRS